MHFDMFAGIRNMQREYCQILRCSSGCPVLFKPAAAQHEAKSASTGDLGEHLYRADNYVHVMLTFGKSCIQVTTWISSRDLEKTTSCQRLFPAMRTWHDQLCV